MNKFAVSTIVVSTFFVSSISYAKLSSSNSTLLGKAKAVLLSSSDSTLLGKAKAVFSPLPDRMKDSKDNKTSVDKIKLGKTLFFEKKLSLNNSMSCNTCHNLKTYGVDNQATSLGVKGQRGGRNSPTVYNAGLHIAQFWDGRAKDLEAQAGGPILNPVEMAMPDEATVLKRLEADSKYKEMFKKAFPSEKKPISYLNLTKAIADFEKTLVTPSKFDKFLKGNVNALNKDEKKGLKTFMEKGCTTCHSGVTVGGQMYQKFGMVKPYKNAKDLGKFELTKDEADKFVFKVPSLRNIAKTAPYFHDGKAKTLSEAVNTMGETQLGIKLSKKENKEIVAFLNSLTGEIKKEFK